MRTMKFGTRTLAGALGALLLSTSGLDRVGAQVAAVPHQMNFQGRLTRPDGTPMADDDYTVTFRIYRTATGGSALWAQTMPVQVRNGVFTARLGSANGTMTGPLNSALFTEDAWLEIQVGSSAPLTPRQPFVSVAYAMKADSVKDGAITGASIAPGSISGDRLAPGALNSVAWLLGGNSGVTNGFLGTRDNTPLELRTNNTRAMCYWQIEDSFLQVRSISSLGGSEINEIGPSVVGGTIAGGGQDNINSNDVPNRVLGHFGTIGGGAGNTAGLDYFATVAGGKTNTASGWGSSITGGRDNRASGSNSVITGGQTNTASGTSSAVTGGAENTASGAYSVAAGGHGNRATGEYSFAAGRSAQAVHSGTFVWNDSRAYDFASTGNNQFLVRANGGVGINTNNPSGYALKVNGSVAGVGAYTNVSDARYKTNIAPIENPLETILNLRGVTFDWREKEFPEMQFAPGRQIGFLAQEVEKALPELVTTDREGYKSVAYASLVPVLVEAMKQQQRRLESQQAQIEALTRRLDAIQNNR